MSGNVKKDKNEKNWCPCAVILLKWIRWSWKQLIREKMHKSRVISWFVFMLATVVIWPENVTFLVETGGISENCSNKQQHFVDTCCKKNSKYWKDVTVDIFTTFFLSDWLHWRFCVAAKPRALPKLPKIWKLASTQKSGIKIDLFDRDKIDR